MYGEHGLCVRGEHRPLNLETKDINSRSEILRTSSRSAVTCTMAAPSTRERREQLLEKLQSLDDDVRSERQDQLELRGRLRTAKVERQTRERKAYSMK